MKPIMKIKIIVDAGMTAALLLLMAYGLVGEQGTRMDYLAVMCLFVFVGYWMTRWLKSFSRVRYKNN